MACCNTEIFVYYPCFDCPRPSASPSSHGVAWYSTGEVVVAHASVMGIHKNCHSGFSSVLAAVRGAYLDDTRLNFFCHFAAISFA
uniref:Uncharacterized protein n=1 Tax=Arundo donax TaxID=35708 RepID=A0A0A9D739_ARUDO